MIDIDENTHRKLPEPEKQILEELFKRKENRKSIHAYVTTTTNLPMRRWNGTHPVEENSKTDIIPKGSTLKVVMVSRLGDFGVTDNLEAEHGYGLRLDFDSAAFENLRFQR